MILRALGILWFVSITVCFYVNKTELTYFFGWEHHLAHDAFPIPLRFLLGLGIGLPILLIAILMELYKKQSDGSGE
jgi:hypothetical protein